MWLILTVLVGMLTVASCQRTTGDVSSSDTAAVLQNILQRKSVRSYRSDMPVEKEKVENLLRAGMAAPSGKDKRPWEFIVVDERELLDSLAAHLPYAKMLTSAPMAIVVCADETKSDYWYLDCSAAAKICCWRPKRKVWERCGQLPIHIGNGWKWYRVSCIRLRR